MCVFVDMRACFRSSPSFCVTCVSEGTSLEEQVRRIKDIEAIESDSFVPLAFKSSRDDIKVRSVSLSLATPHSRYLFTLSLIEFTSPQRCAVCPETAQTKSNIHSAPFVPTWDGFIRRSTVRRLQSGSTHTKATAGNSHPVSPSLCLSLPPLVVQMQTKHRSHYWNVSEGAGIRFVGVSWLFWKDRQQHVTANLHRHLGHILVSLTKVKTHVAAVWAGLSQSALNWTDWTRTVDSARECDAFFHIFHLKLNQVKHPAGEQHLLFTSRSPIWKKKITSGLCIKVTSQNMVQEKKCSSFNHLLFWEPKSFIEIQIQHFFYDSSSSVFRLISWVTSSSLVKY